MPDALPWRRAITATLCGGITATVTAEAGRWAVRVDYPGGAAAPLRDTEAAAMAAAEAIVRERLGA